MTHKTLILTVNSAPDEYAGVKKMEFDSLGGSIGRSPQSFFHLEDHNKYLSGTHALITSYNGEFYLNDISTNGTFINDKRALKNQPSALQEGDTVSLGRYELTVGFENAVQHINLAEDIMPEMKSSDPVESLNVVLPPKAEELAEGGTVEELFFPPDEKADTTEPLYHLQEEEDEAEALIEDETPKPEVDYTPPHRQMLDDSESIHSEMDVPNLIPEDWNFGDEHTAPVPKPAPSPSHQQAALHSGVRSDNQSDTPPVNVPKPESVAPVAESSAVSLLGHAEVSPFSGSQAESAFLEGLGVSAEQRQLCDENWHRQMGLCLRWCLDAMTSELRESLALAGEADESQAHLLDSMLTLYQQSILEPVELVEHIHEELDTHRARLNEARKALFMQQLASFSPAAFEAGAQKNGVGWLKKQRLWTSYQDHFAQQQSNIQSEAQESIDANLATKYREILQGQNA
ncbi:type VI secretion system-associated FHA domain protein TagH [Photobacterium galatheae]|uniref:FHA domain-containing protein n=1 Tax=Photobacterium galatheae TaxID=1654360 RepID=A0A066RTR0_9GAMM|nr:type VI secretion system-associated FHA domain protein TagH [Photobacterium galatheae]KDM91082.1 hypothetical protein EA58_13065 [Photobacterium galatheae]MCM0150198.1 type VI secretion system-associated FHA domain protein TagH [Photobacterium galatheae]